MAMPRITVALAIAAIFTASALSIAGIDAARAQSATDQLQALVDASASRLDIAEQVALAKWDVHGAVEDTLREAQVIAGAVRDGVSRGLDGTAVASFFRAQIEANKLVQYALLAQWHRNGGAPAHASVDLATDIRPRLDQLQLTLVSELANTASLRASEACPVALTKAVQTHLAARHHSVGPLSVIALDRALAATCNAAVASHTP
jgi:chorismate mutase